MLSRRPQTGHSAEDGQGLAEFALVAPILLVIMLSIIQLGWVFSSQIGLTNAVREAARFAATNPTKNTTQAGTNGTETESQLTTILPRNVNFYSATNLSSRTATYCEYADPSGNYSVRVRVTVQYGHPLFIPLIAQLLDGLDGTLDNALRVGAVEEMRVENLPLTASTGINPCP